MERRTAQVVFLIDSAINRQGCLYAEHTSPLVRLCCLRILSSFHNNKLYKDVRWGFRLYDLDGDAHATHRQSNWKEFTLDVFQDFEEKLDNALTCQRPARTPCKGMSASDSGSTTGDHSDSGYITHKSPAAVYSNMLCAVIEDFQWEAPDISTPVKRNRMTSRKPSLHNPSIENYVFNFQVCPRSLQELSAFVGGSCTRPSELIDVMMMNSAKKRWNEKFIKLYWVDSQPAEVPMGDDMLRFYRQSLLAYSGDLMNTSSIVQMGTTHNKAIAALLNAESSALDIEAPLLPMSQIIYSILHPPRGARSPQAVQAAGSSVKGLLHICADNDSYDKLITLSATPLAESTLPVQFLYIAGLVISSCIELNHYNKTSTHLCSVYNTDSSSTGGSNSKLSLLLLELSHHVSSLVLRSKVDNTLYILKPLTLNKATLTAILPQYNVDVEKEMLFSNSVKKTSVSDKTESTQPHMMGNLLEPCGSIVSPGSDQHVKVESTDGGNPTVVRKSRRAPESLLTFYREKRKPKGLNNKSQVSHVKVKEEKLSPAKPKPSRLTKRASFARGAKALEKAAENKRNSTGNTASETSLQAVKEEKKDTPTRKKIALTTMSTIDLTSESELLSYIRQSYECVCTGEADNLYLTAQSIVNTARVFYKHHLNPQESAECLLKEKVISSARQIRKSCAAKPERKVRECQFTVLLIMELENLKHELNQATKDLVEPAKDEVVSTLEEYLTAMSMGKPHLLKEFLVTSLVPCYQLTLAPLLSLLLTDLGQDMPTSLRRFLEVDESEATDDVLPSLASVSSRRSSIISPASLHLPSVHMYSEPGENSLLTSTMLGGGNRKFGIRSNSDVHAPSRRSIAVPGELLKKQRKSRGKRRASNQHQSGVASRTRSKTPKKDSQAMLTEFPKGFLSVLNSGASFSQSLADLRRSPRVAGLSRSAAPPTKKDVKRDLFASPTSSHRRSLTCRSPRRLKCTPQKRRNNPADNDRAVLVAETPHHKQGRNMAEVMGTQRQVEHDDTSPAIGQVVEESPEKPLTDTEQQDVPQANNPQASGSARRRLNRRKSFYDNENIKSRNIEKFQKLETRMKTNSIGAKCSPRRFTQLIFKQALSQPMDRVTSKLSPNKPDDKSPPTEVVVRRRSRKLQPNSETMAISNSSGQTGLMTKHQLKKKLFMSPTSTAPVMKSSGENETLEVGGAVPSNDNLVVNETPQKQETAEETPEKSPPYKLRNTPVKLTPAKGTPVKGVSARGTPCKLTQIPFNSPRMSTRGTPHKHIGETSEGFIPSEGDAAMRVFYTDGIKSDTELSGSIKLQGETAGETTQPRKRKRSRTEQLILNTPTKSGTHTCLCGTPTPKRSRKSPLHSAAMSPNQQKVCQFAHGGINTAFCQDALPPAQASPSPKRLNFQSRKRGTDPLTCAGTMKPVSSLHGDEEITFPQLEKCGIVLKDNQYSNQLIESVFSPSKHTNNPNILSPSSRKSPRRVISTLVNKSPKILIPTMSPPLIAKPTLNTMTNTPHHKHVVTMSDTTTPQRKPIVTVSDITPQRKPVVTVSDTTPQHKTLLKAKGTPKYSPIISNTDLQSLMCSPFANKVKPNAVSDDVADLFNFADENQ